MGIVITILVPVLLISVAWAGIVICIDLGKSLARARWRFRYDLLDLLIVTGGIGGWIGTARLMWNSPLFGPTLLMVTMLIPLMWIVKLGWLDAVERKRLRRERLAAPPPQTFEPPAGTARAKPRRFLKIRSRANSLLAPRLSRYSLSERPLQLKE